MEGKIMKHIEDYEETFTNDCYMEHIEGGKVLVAACYGAIYDDEQEACEEWERLITKWSR